MSEQPEDERMNIYLAVTITVLWYIGYPIAFVLYYAAHAIVFVLRTLYRPVAFLLQPLVYLGHFILACLIAPFALLAKFETLYIYLGIAALVGVAIGLAQRYLYGRLSRLLRLDSKPKVSPPARTAKEYREAKRREQAKAEAPLISAGSRPPSYLSTPESARNGRSSRGLLGQTIMEEMESE
ncbi:hypothetical protein LTR35_005028 [Friedmanniomyces endolithicus]|uniref:Uncharacterized protein n=1 Tax=Friedmanniomyces endolithicus TaxID=329885 RepID=A0AAN6G2X3_9PEZI|nr:hypothetical protein LTR35_005028 [Friedmanniomyces endolithicus]KAK0298837.1 hypothetical protein LTS00_002599 [Friedmanniomyces endolithicus]KAK0328828.1 hypothetical protein LTR82_000761 [Friedmanniomyces endolithicus]KAK1003944.1 hypothetical protein LTR54_007708 [Friedmanniomyces endolithicus]KAK1075327.1 hypothetical protein LTR74_000289 [Friedmanniomyces endolithicus]